MLKTPAVLLLGYGVVQQSYRAIVLCVGEIDGDNVEKKVSRPKQRALSAVEKRYMKRASQLIFKCQQRFQ